MESEPKVHDEAPPEVGDHPFEPRDKWWSLCKHCGLAQAAHSSSTIDTLHEILKEQMETYGEVRHADPNRKANLERQFREFERKRVHSGGRSRIGYYEDDFDDE